VVPGRRHERTFSKKDVKCLTDDEDFDFGMFDGEERMARCRACGWIVQPDELIEHKLHSCPVSFGELPDSGFPLPENPNTIH
jgi:hypothetical protein